MCIWERERETEEGWDCLTARMNQEQLRKSPLICSHFLFYIGSFAFQLAVAWSHVLHGCLFPDKLKEQQVKQTLSGCDFLCLIFDWFTSKIMTTAILYLQTANASTVSWMNPMTLLHKTEVFVPYKYTLNTTHTKKHFPTKLNKGIVKWSIVGSCP